MEIICPSGLSGELRGMRVREEALMSDRKLLNSGRMIGSLLEACWVRTINPGPYGKLGEKPDLSQVSSADRTYMLLQLRMQSFGTSYEFDVACGNCERTIKWQCELTEFATRPMKPEGVEHLRTGAPIVRTLPSGMDVKFRLGLGADEEYMAKLDKKERVNISTHNLARRVLEIDGKTAWKDVFDAVADLAVIDGDYLHDQIDEIEGGVDLSFDIECPKCASRQLTMLPFEMSFFSSRKRLKRTRDESAG
jgi:hypothetical protein